MANVDAFLGDHSTRYFGDGHKRSNYAVFTKNDESTYGRITQTGIWSNKSDKEVQPHLSTLDGVILASMLTERLMEKQISTIENYYLSKFDIKSGMKPIENLNEIPMQLKQFEVGPGVIKSEVLVLDMKVKIEFSEIEAEIASDNKNGERTKEFIANHLKEVYHDIYDISLLDTLDSADKCIIFCKANRNVPLNNEFKGLSSNLTSNYSLLELLIIFSQMAEIVVYHADNIDRECSETLWMKSVQAELRSPIPAQEVYLLGKITKNRLLDIKGQHWKIFEMSGTDINNQVTISSKVAHQLPVQEASNA